MRELFSLVLTDTDAEECVIPLPSCRVSCGCSTYSLHSYTACAMDLFPPANSLMCVLSSLSQAYVINLP